MGTSFWQEEYELADARQEMCIRDREHPALSLDTSKLSLEESVNPLLELVLPIVCLLYTSKYPGWVKK